MADMVLNHISEDLHTWAVNLSREKFERDRISAFAYARETGWKEGCEQGIAEGSHAQAIETARTMLRDGEDLNKIQRYSGLSLSEIQELQ